MTDLRFDREFEVTPGTAEVLSPLVRRVLCNNPSAYTFKGTNSFIIGRGSVAVIDPGPDDDAHLEALLRAVDGETVSHILVTHSHADHSPLAARLARATGAPTLAYGAIAAADSAALRLDAGIDHRFTPDHCLADGDVVEGRGWRLEALFTPGHMSNHMCFALPAEKALFAGDHVMAWATSVIAPPDGNMGQYFHALRRLLERDDAIYHPGHGPARPDPLPLVRGYLAHRKMREAAILQRLREGDRQIGDIVARLYSDVDPRLHGAAALSVRAHLDHLCETGAVRQTEGVYEVL